ncbi:MAG: RHS repeat-associated core domain-containing protein, partial [Paludibacteraceae bacterium]|nr:RHS repeat-associated core domain-containing protein [Paludibacteraceae bacterium]
MSRSTSYIPYGEIFVEESSAGWQSPYYFNSKELDEETGLYYYGARYLNPTEARWLSVDPMWEKYAGMSPYNYCAGNPVKFVDVEGEEIDETQLIQEQKLKYRDNVGEISKGSILFNKLYSLLKDSKTTYTIRIGETQNNVPAQFNAKDNSVTFKSADIFGNTSAVAEEFFHVFQLSENKGKYDKGSFNYEFEAKIFATAVTYTYGGNMAVDGMSDIQEKIYNNDFGNDEACLIFEKLNSQPFFEEYQKAANGYAIYNIENNIGNANYKKATEVAPYSLLR